MEHQASNLFKYGTGAKSATILCRVAVSLGELEECPGSKGIRSVASEPKFGQGGTLEKDWIVDSAHHGNTSLYLRIHRGGSRTQGAGRARSSRSSSSCHASRRSCAGT